MRETKSDQQGRPNIRSSLLSELWEQGHGRVFNVNCGRTSDDLF